MIDDWWLTVDGLDLKLSVVVWMSDVDCSMLSSYSQVSVSLSASTGLACPVCHPYAVGAVWPSAFDCRSSVVDIASLYSGGYGDGVPPLPIPNREVKPVIADGTAMQCGRVGSRLFSFSVPLENVLRRDTFLCSPIEVFRHFPSFTAVEPQFKLIFYRLLFYWNKWE